MASKSVTITPTYHELVVALKGAEEDFDSLRRVFSQLGAIAYNARHPEVKRAEDVLELASYIADDWANTADLCRERIMETLAKISA